MQDLQEGIMKTAALENAKLYSGALKEFRTIYTSEVVERIRSHPDISVSHDYLNTENSIPLPVTLNIKLGERLGRNVKGAETKIYSAYPFPWRDKDGGLKDGFQRQAWKFLNLNPDLPYYQFSQYKGKKALRYATADIMRAACVNCHNSHPDTPKASWQEGDVRGVLEIIHPMEKVLDQTADGNRGIFILAIMFILTVLFCLIFLIYRFQRNAKELERQVKERTEQITSTEKKLVLAQKMAAIGEISSGIAHEINQPLASIKITSSSLKKSVKTGDSEKANRQLARIEDQIERISKIICHLNTRNQNIGSKEHQPIAIHEIINTAVEQVQLILAQGDCQLEVTLSQGNPSVLCDALELERVLINLLTNSLHAVEKNSEKKISLTMKLDSDHIYLSVDDNGCGIPLELQDRIFDPFFTAKTVGKGTGLDLSLCYGIVKKHNGDIKLDTSFEGWTRILISLPVFKLS